MPRSISCRLSKERQPTFPDRCVVCKKEKPAATARVVAKGPSRSLLRDWFTVVVPACPRCGFRLRWQAALRSASTVVIAGVAMGAAALVSFELGFRDAALGGISFGVLVVAMIGLVAWQRSHPPEFKIEVGFVNVDYEFRDRQYAVEFAELNGLKFQ